MKTRILFLIESMMVGGAEKVLIDLVNGMDKEKFDIHVVSIFKESVYTDYKVSFDKTFNENIRYTWLCDNSDSFKYKMFCRILNNFPRIIANRLIKDKYDIMVAFYEGAPTRLLSFVKGKMKKIAWLHIVTSQSMKGRDVQDIIKEYKTYDHIIAVSRIVKESFNELTQDKSGRCIVKHNPVLNKKIRAKGEIEIRDLNNVDKLPLFVTVGRLFHQKGYDRLLRITSRLHNEGYNFRLQFIGDGILKEKLIKMRNELNLNDYVEFLGNKSNPYPYVKNADWFICSSYGEGYSTAVTESLILGTPVLTTECAGMDELIEYNSKIKPGIITANNEESLYDGLKNLLNNKQDWSKYKKDAEIRGDDFDYNKLIADISSMLLSS